MIINITANVDLQENLHVSDVVGTNGALVSYVVNSTTGAATLYDNFNFNSFAQMNGKFYGIADGGLYELTGNTDAGTVIAASIKLGNLSLETDVTPAESLKRVPAAYIGVNTAGTLTLNVTANGATNAYPLSPGASASLHEGRVLLGKGVASRYWGFELVNTSGTDFTVESITLRPVALNRRVE